MKFLELIFLLLFFGFAYWCVHCWLIYCGKVIIERFGYVEGDPSRVFCSCGSKCFRIRYLKREENGKLLRWTEWICTECHPSTEVNEKI